jgi:hypothetical protein
MSATFVLRDFLARSTDETFEESTLGKVLAALPRVSPQGPWIAGGAIRRVLLGQEPDSDFDFFFRDAAQLAQFSAILVEMGMEKVRETDHHIHYRGTLGLGALPRDIQCIRFSFYANAAAVVDSFDFTLCQFAFDGERVTCGEHSLWDLGRKRLAIHKITYPVSTMRRLLKYGQQGFTACAGCLASILRETATKPELLTALDIEYVD